METPRIPDALDILFQEQADPYQTAAAMFVLSDSLAIELGVHNHQIRSVQVTPVKYDPPATAQTWRKRNGDGLIDKAITLNTVEEYEAARKEAAAWFFEGEKRTWFLNGTDKTSYVFNNEFIDGMRKLKAEGKLPAIEPMPENFFAKDAGKVVTLDSARRGLFRRAPQ